MSTFPDGLYQYGGAAVSSDPRFDGWWGGEVYFVDYDNGTANAGGLKMTDPLNGLQYAIDKATTDATIYVRPRTFSSEDPQQITPRAAENFHIDAAKTSMSIIGTGKGLGHAAAHKAWIGGYSGLTTAVLSVYAPGCVIENLRAQPPSSAAYGIFYSINDDTYDGGNTTFINNDFHDANTTGGIRLCSTWQMSIVGNRFVNCDVGIYVTSSYCVPQIFSVWDNIFVATGAEVQNDFRSVGGVKRFSAYNNKHCHSVPSLGGTNVYYSFSTTSTGMISNCYFGQLDTAATNLMTLNGIVQSGNYSTEGIVISA